MVKNRANLAENNLRRQVVGSSAQRVRPTTNSLRKTEVGDLYAATAKNTCARSKTHETLAHAWVSARQQCVYEL